MTFKVTITDGKGAGIPGLLVTANDEMTGGSFSRSTDGGGYADVAMLGASKEGDRVTLSVLDPQLRYTGLVLGDALVIGAVDQVLAETLQPFKKPSPLPAPPTRDQLCAVRMSFQGLIFDTPTYGQVYWWETLAWWPARTDREAAYAAKRAAGDTHAILDLSGCYKEGIPGDYNDIGADYSQNLPALVALAEEAIKAGFWIDLRLAGDGQGAGPGYNDPVGHTYGHDWLMANFPRIAAAFAHLVDYIVFVPGYDGVFYGWEPEQVVAFGQLFRSIFPQGTLGIEFNTGHIPLGEGPGYQGAYAPGGCMQDYDVIYGEFDPFNYHADSTWQICGRLVEGYVRPADQPAGDDPHPPYLLGTPNVRGPWYFIAFEILTYVWVRGQTTPGDIAAYRAYFAAMGCRYIC